MIFRGYFFRHNEEFGQNSILGQLPGPSILLCRIMTIMIYVTPEISINEREIQEDFIHASGPGGQNVNKVASAVLVRFHVRKSPSLPDDVRKRLIHMAGSRITEDGLLIIHARRFRSQKQNRQDARDRLVELIRKAAKKPRPRRKTTPTHASRIRRLNSKRRRSITKRLRRIPSSEE